MLVRQAVDQIDVGAGEAEPPRLFEQGIRRFDALHAMHGLLDLGIEVLHAEADAVEAELAQDCQLLEGRDPRVDFDADFGVIA
jgi:hypothetical protein